MNGLYGLSNNLKYYCPFQITHNVCLIQKLIPGDMISYGKKSFINFLIRQAFGEF